MQNSDHDRSRSPHRPTGIKRVLAPLLLGLIPPLLLLDFFAASIEIVLPARTYLALAVVLAAAAYLAGLPHGRRVATGLAITFVVVLLLADTLLLGTRKEFFRRADRLELGMSRAEVAAVMRQAPRPGPFGFGDLFHFEGSWPGDNGGCNVSYDEAGALERVTKSSDFPLLEGRGGGAVVYVK